VHRARLRVDWKRQRVAARRRHRNHHEVTRRRPRGRFDTYVYRGISTIFR
jgi:hypothetical protein